MLWQLETSDPEEVTDAWIDDALGLASASTAGTSAQAAVPEGNAVGRESTPPVSSGAMTPTAPLDKGEEGKAFARPARPGRKR